MHSCALPADLGRRRPPPRGPAAPRIAPRRRSLGCRCPCSAEHASARQAGRAAAARPLRWLSFIQRAAREEVQAPPGVTPPSPQVPTDGGRARWAPMATNGACPGHRRVPGGRERLCRAVCMYSLYTVLYALSVTRRARALSICMVQEVIICDVDIMYFYSIINHTLSDPQWRASRADMWVRQ